MTATEPLTTQSATGRAGAARPLSYPGPPRRAAPRLLAKLRGDRLGLLADAAAEYGDVIRFRIGPKTLYYFNHPEHASMCCPTTPAITTRASAWRRPGGSSVMAC